MADQSNDWRRVSYSRTAPDLPGTQSGMDTKALRPVFEANRCPWRAKQREDADMSEAERREHNARNARRESFMVKRSKPKPELKPSDSLSYGPDRAAFNQAWREEYRDAAPQPRERSRQR